VLQRFVQWLNNARAVALAIAVHVVALGILLINLEWTDSKPKSLNTAAPAKTTAVDSKLIKKEMDRLKQAELDRKKAAERQRKKIEREKKRLAELEKKRKAKEQELKRLAEKKKKEETARKLAAKKKREKEEQARKLAEKKKREKAEKDRRVTEQKRKKELERKRSEQAEQQRRQNEMQAALAAEETASLIEHYASLINQHVQDRWDVPPDSSIKIGMACQVSATLLPSGDILKLTIKVSSGSKVFDDSALKAVRRAEPLPLPPAKENLFDEFRHITIPFVLRTKKT